MMTPSEILAPQGRIAARLPDYEHRPQQLAMADAVASAIADGEHLLAEAGTGVGKSFAYLVPAILAATEGGESEKPRRIVVSTHTIALQEQLINKDLPFLNSVIPREFTAVLVKGRRNYLSLRRLNSAAARAGSLFFAQDEIDQVRRLRDWSKKTDDGSLSDLEFRPDSGVWDEAASDSGNCMGRNCPAYNDCFYFRARRRAQNAQILVVNHALFFSDLALRRVGVRLIPDYDTVILDEAHTVESVAGDHLGLAVTSGQVDYALNKLYNDRTNKGLLVHHGMGEAQRDVLQCRHRADEFFDKLADWLGQQSYNNGRVTEPNIIANPLSPALDSLAKKVKKQGEGQKNDSERQDLLAAHDRLVGLADEIERWRAQELPQAVYWADRSWTRRGRPKMRLAAAPIDVGPALREHLFDKTRCVVLTSATLAVGRKGSFDFLKSRIGLTQSRAVQLDSPFDFQRQAQLILVRGMPDPSREKQMYERRCTEAIQRYVARTDGHAFILFTSYEMLRSVAAKLTPWLAQHDLGLYSQADGLPRHQMIERFKQNPRAVLLGTDSFWQGVDVPGDALQNVIITKLPFSVPDQPLLQARLDAIRDAGGNPFIDYQLPEAVIKLRQGFGRLIRSQQDEGIVVLLDPRVTTKPYGRTFIESLPECEIISESLSDEAMETT